MQILFPIVGYLVGAVPFGLLVGKMAGVDVRQSGSKNIGATNVSRLLGKKLGVITLACDCLKGLLPMVAASYLFKDSPQGGFIVPLTGVLAVIGHMFPIYLGFKGGKGVATGLGVFLFLSPVAILISLAVFVATVALTGFVSAGSLLASGLMPIWLLLLGGSKGAIIASLIIAVLIWAKHHQNIGRLVRGEEKSWKKDSSH